MTSSATFGARRRERDAAVGHVRDEPEPASFLTIADADAAVTPSRSASAFVDTAPPSPRVSSA